MSNPSCVHVPYVVRCSAHRRSTTHYSALINGCSCDQDFEIANGIMKATLIDWSDELVDLLFYYVLSSGAHIAPRDKVTAKWNEVNDNFFNHDELCSAIKEKHYTRGKFRKLRDKYEREKTNAHHEMSTGNKSKYEGDVSQVYKRIKQAIDEEEAHEEALKDKVTVRICLANIF